METKFAVGQVWRNRCGELRRIIGVLDFEDFDYPIQSDTLDPSRAPDSAAHTSQGNYYEDGRDLIELVTNADGTAVASSNAITSLTPDDEFDAARTEFIDRIVHDLFLKSEYDEAETERRVRAAVRVRDELVGALF